MIPISRSAFLQTQNLIYWTIRPLIFQQDAQVAHESAMRLLARLDAEESLQSIMRIVNTMSFPDSPITVGNVQLPHPMILAAGFVKGHGFETEHDALNAISHGINIIPGWRTMPTLVGPVEFGSFTRWPRLGNPGTMIWRDTTTYSTQNRVGLKNPGAKAAAEFLSQRSAYLPKAFGINIAVSPRLNDPDKEAHEVREALNCFISQNMLPSWFTLNVSCPNTEDDPGNHQTQENTHRLCAEALGTLSGKIPLWVKISPGLALTQYAALADVFNDLEIPAVITTNTLGQPAPGSPDLNAGVGGGRLQSHALNAVTKLKESGYKGDIIGCGGILDPISYMKFKQAGAVAFQYWSALVYMGPLGAAHILNEVKSYEL